MDEYTFDEVINDKGEIYYRGSDVAKFIKVKEEQFNLSMDNFCDQFRKIAENDAFQVMNVEGIEKQVQYIEAILGNPESNTIHTIAPQIEMIKEFCKNLHARYKRSAK